MDKNLLDMEVVSAKISTIVHATEDIDLVLQALNRVFPDGTFPSKVETRKFHGHYGNEIRMINVSVRGTLVRPFLEHLWKTLPSFDRASILDRLGYHVDRNGGLHLRLDKQETSRGALRIRDQDPIKIHLSFQSRIKFDPISDETIKQLLQRLEDD